jgi:AAA family ATP:ADP antiporter
MSADASDNPTRNVLARVLGLERHEYIGVAWSFVYFFCVLSSYYMLRPMREALGVDSGVGTIPWLFSSTFVIMLGATSVFGWIASRYPRRTFLPWVYVFFAANILIFYGLFQYAISNDITTVWIGRVFFVWISVFNLFVVSVFWSFMADIYTREQGRRLFGVISAGGSAGALAGPFIVSTLVVPLGFQNLLPISAALLLFSILCIRQLRRWVQSEHSGETVETMATPKPLGGGALDGISHVAKSKFLASISAKQIIASLLGTALYMFMNYLVGEAVEGTDQRTRIFGFIDAATGVLSLLFQLLVVKHSVRRLGLGMTLALLPLVSVIGFTVLAVNPTLMFVAVFQAARRAIGFGFVKPSTDMLYSVVTPDEKYKSKNFIETAVYRGGDLVGTWSVKAMWGIGISWISIALVPFAILWALIALWLGREYRRRAATDTTGETSESETLESA